MLRGIQNDLLSFRAGTKLQKKQAGESHGQRACYLRGRWMFEGVEIVEIVTFLLLVPLG